MAANIDPIFVGGIRLALAQVSTANTNLDGTGAIASLIAGATDGTMITRVTVKAEVTTSAGMIRFFVKDGANVWLVHEVDVTAITQGATTKTFSAIVEELAGLCLGSAQELQASTEKGETFTIMVEAGDF